jgi:uncharacterized membrane protein
VIAAEIGPVDLDTTTVVTYVLIGVIVMLAALVMSWSLVLAARRPPPAALITALSMLTLFSIAGGIATANDEAWTIAAAGVGALAGSVTSMFQEGRHQIVEQALAERVIAAAESSAVAEAAIEEANGNGGPDVPQEPDPDGGDHPDPDHRGDGVPGRPPAGG